jgi:hypothetical protein
MHIYAGTLQTPIDTVTIFTDCPVCNSHQHCDLLVYSEYFHIYGLPIFPTSKSALLICTNCGYKRTPLFNRGFILSNSIDARLFKHPVYCYIGLIVILIFIGTAIIAKNL